MRYGDQRVSKLYLKNIDLGVKRLFKIIVRQFAHPNQYLNFIGIEFLVDWMDLRRIVYHNKKEMLLI